MYKINLLRMLWLVGRWGAHGGDTIKSQTINENDYGNHGDEVDETNHGDDIDDDFDYDEVYGDDNSNCW